MLVCPDCRKNIGKFTTFAQGEDKPRAVRCGACGWQRAIEDGILNAMPSKYSRLRSGYLDYYEQLAEQDLSSPFIEQEYAAALNQRTAISLGELRDKSGCELGVGTGHLVRELLGRGAKMTAVDISSTYLKALVGYGDMPRVQADAENLPFQNEFDFVTCTDVMEHVLNPGNLLYCINDALKPGGVAAIRVPADENPLLYSNHLGCEYDIVHLRSFNEAAFRQMLEGAGFAVKSLEPDGHSLSMALPNSCENSAELLNDVGHVRALLIERGVTPAELMKTPPWFKNLLSKPYFYLAIAEKTHRIFPSTDQGFVLEPLK